MNASNPIYNTLYKKSIELTNTQLERFLEKEIRPDLYDMSAYAIFGGEPKRIRPFMVMLSAMAVGGKGSYVKDAMVGIELLHSATFIHDDIIDKSDLRRGDVTIYKKYGIPSAVVLGDFLLVNATTLLSSSAKALNQERKKAFQKMIFELCEGQLRDSLYETKDADIKTCLDVSYQKTGSLCEYACFLGSHMSSGSKQEVRALSLYGRYIGIAFQIQNDVNNLFCNKSGALGEDLVANKKTYMVVKALELDKATTDLFLKKWKGLKKINQKDIREYQTFLVQTGVLDSAKKDIKKYCDMAVKSIENLKDSKAKECLISMPDFLF